MRGGGGRGLVLNDFMRLQELVICSIAYVDSSDVISKLSKGQFIWATKGFIQRKLTLQPAADRRCDCEC